MSETTNKLLNVESKMNIKKPSTVEPQYERCVEVARNNEVSRFGIMSNFTWHDDPKRLLFVLSRYKFVAKMLSGSNHVLEVGCADAFGTRVVLQDVNQLTAIDIDPVFVEDVLERMGSKWTFNCKVHDIIQGPLLESFDGAYSLDVLEHIHSDKEKFFISNIVKSLTVNGVLVVGSPSLQSQAYASPGSKEGHINCKTHKELKDLMSSFFHNVFIFSMNDEVVHTGFYPMAHYLIALCCNKKER